MAIKRWNASTSQWELVGTPGTATPAAIGAAALVGNNTFSGSQTVNFTSGTNVNTGINFNFTGAGGSDFKIVRNSTANTQTVRTFRIRGGNDFDGFTSFELGMESNHPLRFITNDTERMRITPEGNLGIGVSSPSYGIHHRVFGNAEIATQYGTGLATYIGAYAAEGSLRVSGANPLTFYTNSLERMRIEANGNVILTNQGVDTLKYFDIYNTSSGNSAGTIIRMITNNAANTAVTTVDIVKYRNGYFGILNNDASAVIGFGTGGTERMRIDASGNVGIGNTSPDSPITILTSTLGVNKPALRINNTNTTGAFNWATSMINSAMTTGQSLIQIMGKAENSRNSGYIGYRWVGDASTSNAITFGHFAVDNVVNIDGNGYLLAGYLTSNGAYRLQVNSQIFATSSSIATSDGRYKENVLPITSGLDIVDSLNPVSFSWKEHPVHNFVPGKTVGFIAQEVQEALSEYDWADNIIKTNMTGAVLDEEGNEVTPAEEFLGIAESNIIPLLVAAVKELRAEVNTLKAQLSN